MKRWNIRKFNSFGTSLEVIIVHERAIETLTDVLEWLSYNRGSFDWHEDEWQGHLYELEMSDND